MKKVILLALVASTQAIQLHEQPHGLTQTSTDTKFNPFTDPASLIKPLFDVVRAVVGAAPQP